MLHSHAIINHEYVPPVDTTIPAVVEMGQVNSHDIYQNAESGTPVSFVEDMAAHSDVKTKYMDTGEYLPPVPQVLTLTDEAYSDTFDAVRDLPGLRSLELILRDRKRAHSEDKPIEPDLVRADEAALRAWDAGRYNHNRFHGQMAIAVKGIWAEGAKEHEAHLNSEKREFHLTPELAEKMFALHQAALERNKRIEHAGTEAATILVAHWAEQTADDGTHPTDWRLAG